MEWAFPGSAALWQAAWAAIPVALLIAFLCRAIPFRPATRHTLWVTALLAFVIPVIVPESPRLAILDAPSAEAPPAALPSAPAQPIATTTTPRPTDAIESVAASGRVRPEPMQRRMRATPPAARPATPDSPPAAPATTASEAEPATGPRAPFFAVSPESAGSRTTTMDAATPAPKRGVSRPGDLNQLSARRAAQESGPVVAPVSTPVVPVAQPSATAESSISAWLAAASVAARAIASALRNVVAAIPMIPLQIWLVGIALLLLFQLARMAAFRRSLRHAIPANATIVRSVEEMAASLGLRSAPQTLMVNERVSPLIWCGRRPLLILPMELWAQLDKHGRKAILAHELAHLKRRDHWVCWAEMLISIVYWWHPLVWWIRRRIAEEADLSCDAWVTWLMPQGRRAYAEALLATKQFIGESRAAAPAGGLGVTTVGTRRFARRLTMVMTQKGRPRTSMVGMLLATSVAAAGWMASPALSCPPAEKAAKDAKLAKIKGAAQPTAKATCQDAGPTITVTAPAQGVEVWSTTPAVAGSPVAVTLDPFVVNLTDKVIAPGVTAFTPDSATIATTVQPFVAAFPGTNSVAWTFGEGQSAPKANDDDDAALAERLSRLEAELRRLSEQLHGSHHAHGAQGGHTPAPKARAPVSRAKTKSIGRGQATTPTPPVPPVPPTPPMPPMPPTPPAPPAPPAQAFGGASNMWAPGAAGQGGFFGGGPAAASDNAIQIKSYKLPKGKLEALLALMIRDDVPVRVRQNGDSIEVHGNARQQEIFSAFISIIHPAGAKSSGQGPSQGPSRAGVRGAAAPNPARNTAALRALEEAAAARGQAQSAALRRLASIENLQATIAEAARAGADAKTRDTVRSLIDRTRAAAAERNAAAGGIEHEAEGMWEQAQEMSRNAEKLAAEAEAMAAKMAEKAGADAARELEKGSRELELKAREMEQKVREMERRARDLEREAGRIESEAEEFEGHADSLDEILEAALEEMNESIESADVEIFEETPEAEEIEIPDVQTPEKIEAPVIAPATPR